MRIFIGMFTNCRFYGIMRLVMRMEKGNSIPKRKPVRLQNFDYNAPGIYFITICTENRKCILSRIVGGDVLDAPNHVELLPYGKIADKYIKQLNDFYTDISVTNYVIMPDHIHIMLFVHGNGASRTSPPTKQHSVVSHFISTFKRFCNKEYGVNVWQRHFYDHIIRGKQDFEEHLSYIRENPIRWHYEHLAEQKFERGDCL